MEAVVMCGGCVHNVLRDKNLFYISTRVTPIGFDKDCSCLSLFDNTRNYIYGLLFFLCV